MQSDIRNRAAMLFGMNSATPFESPIQARMTQGKSLEHSSLLKALAGKKALRAKY